MKLLNMPPSIRCLMLVFLLGSVLVLVPSCAGSPAPAAVKAPPAADLVREEEPQLDASAVLNDSAAALDDYDTRHASWGRRGWDQVGRLCWWLKDAGAPTPDCGPRPPAK